MKKPNFKQHNLSYIEIKETIFDKELKHIKDYVSVLYGIENYKSDAEMEALQRRKDIVAFALRARADFAFKANNKIYTIDLKETTKANQATGNATIVYFEFFIQWFFPNPFAMLKNGNDLSFYNLKKMDNIKVYMPKRTHCNLQQWKDEIYSIAKAVGYNGYIDFKIKDNIKGVSGLPFILLPMKDFITTNDLFKIITTNNNNR